MNTKKKDKNHPCLQPDEKEHRPADKGAYRYGIKDSLRVGKPVEWHKSTHTLSGQLFSFQ